MRCRLYPIPSPRKISLHSVDFCTSALPLTLSCATIACVKEEGTPVTAILYAEINILEMLLLVILGIRTGRRYFPGSQRNRCFSCSVYLAAVSNLFDLLWNFSIRGFLTPPSGILWLFNFFYFLFFALAGYSFLLYVDVTIGRRLLKHRWQFWAALLPTLALVVLLLHSRFSGVLFWFDSHMHYHRGPLFYCQQLLSYIYVAIATLQSLWVALLGKEDPIRREYLGLASFALPPIVFGIAQIFLQDIPLLSVGVCMSYLLAYSNMLQSMISLDPLTRSHNRRELQLYLSGELKNPRHGQSLWVLFLDLDHFKAINDTRGHHAGDLALTRTARVLEGICQSYGGFCARYAGDEFVLVRYAREDTEPEKISLALRQKLSEHDLTASLGWAKLAPGDTVSSLLSRADAAMYRDKQGRH